MNDEAAVLDELAMILQSEIDRFEDSHGPREVLVVADSVDVEIDGVRSERLADFLAREDTPRRDVVVAVSMERGDLDAVTIEALHDALELGGLLVIAYLDKTVGTGLDKPPYLLLAQSVRMIGDRELTVFVLHKNVSELGWGGPAPASSISVVITCHNYGRFLPEAVASVLAQSVLPDEILLSDDASTDDSAVLMESFAERFPDLVRVNVNDTNLGIVDHFNQAVAHTTGTFVTMLDADNRMPSNYVETLARALEAEPDVAVAYTDFALFGALSRQTFEGLRQDFRGRHVRDDLFTTDFPVFSEASRELVLAGTNFIHGNSMFRRAAFDQVGGYASREEGAEDKVLFRKMLQAGWSALKAEGTHLDYRQHGADQANLQFAYFAELSLLRSERTRLRTKVYAQGAEIDRLNAENATLVQHRVAHEAIARSWSFKVGRLLVFVPGRVRRLLGSLLHR